MTAPANSSGATFISALRMAGIDLVVTLPDAWMGGLIDAAEDAPDITLLRVTREDEAVGICAGAWLGGRRAVMLVQNAGLLLSANALAGMALHHQIPLLLVVAQRGESDDDQYYQVYKGRVTIPVLEALRLPWHRIATMDQFAMLPQAMRQAELSRRPVALLCARAALRAEPAA